MKKSVIVVGLIVVGCMFCLYIFSPRKRSKNARTKVDGDLGKNPPLVEVENVGINLGSAKEETKTSVDRDPDTADGTPKDKDYDDLHALDSEVFARADATLGRYEFAVKYGDPREFLQLRMPKGIPYTLARSVIKRDKLPILYEMIEDPNCASKWPGVAKLIAYVGDANSVPVLLSYFERDDSWNFRSTGRLSGKIWSLVLIGIIGGPKSDDVLRKAITEKGVAELGKNWINKEWHIATSDTRWNSKEFITMYIRSCAIKGLAISGKPENADIVSQLYSEEIEYCKANKKRTDMYYTLVDAMAMQDFIAENGQEAYLSLHGNRMLDIIDPYLAKYKLRF